MKQSTAGQSALMLLLTALLLAYFGIEAYRYFAYPFSTAFTYPYEVELSVDLMGYVVRQEQVLDGDVSGFLRTERAEGEKVSAGGTVALVYEDQAALDEALQPFEKLFLRRGQLAIGDFGGRADSESFQEPRLKASRRAEAEGAWGRI